MKAILRGEMPWPWFNLCPNRCCFEMTQSKKGWMKRYLTIHLFCHNFAIYRKYKCVWVKYERQVLWCLWIDNHVITFNFFFWTLNLMLLFGTTHNIVAQWLLSTKHRVLASRPQSQHPSTPNEGSRTGPHDSTPHWGTQSNTRRPTRGYSGSLRSCRL